MTIHHKTIKAMFDKAIKEVKAVDLQVVLSNLVKEGYKPTIARVMLIDTVWLAIWNFRGEVQEDIESNVNEAECIKHYIECAFENGVEASYMYPDSIIENAFAMLAKAVALPEYCPEIICHTHKDDKEETFFVVGNTEKKIALLVNREESRIVNGESYNRRWFVIIDGMPQYFELATAAQVAARNKLMEITK